MRKLIADVPVAAIPVSKRPLQTAAASEPAIRIVIAALGAAVVFLAARMIGQL